MAQSISAKKKTHSVPDTDQPRDENGDGGGDKDSRAPPSRSPASGAPSGNAAVAKKSETVNPIAAARPTTSRSLRRTPGGRCAPANRATPENIRIPIGFPTRSAARTSYVPAPMAEKGTARHW